MISQTAPASVVTRDATSLAPHRGYDILADEYYSPRHVTSRNFDMATHAYLQNHPVPTPEKGLALDLGAGKGRLREYCGVQPMRIVQTDLSARMLTLPARELALGRVQAGALALPFKASSFSIVAAFLFDPFNEEGLFEEIARVLSSGGVFIGTVPHNEWGLTLRSGTGRPMDEAVFVLDDGATIVQPSALSRPDQLADRLTSVGLTIVKNEALKLPRDVTNISPDIERPARITGQSVYSIPIVQLVVARRV
jgi:SAM-dependent methyltransferase